MVYLETLRSPQSAQSVPRSHMSHIEPGPPSSHSSSCGELHVLVQPALHSAQPAQLFHLHFFDHGLLFLAQKILHSPAGAEVGAGVRVGVGVGVRMGVGAGVAVTVGAAALTWHWRMVLPLPMQPSPPYRLQPPLNECLWSNAVQPEVARHFA